MKMDALTDQLGVTSSPAPVEALPEIRELSTQRTDRRGGWPQRQQAQLSAAANKWNEFKSSGYETLTSGLGISSRAKPIEQTTPINRQPSVGPDISCESAADVLKKIVARQRQRPRGASVSGAAKLLRVFQKKKLRIGIRTTTVCKPAIRSCVRLPDLPSP